MGVEWHYGVRYNSWRIYTFYDDDPYTKNNPII